MFFFVIMAVAGFGAAVYGAVTIVRTYRFLGRAQRTEGTVIGWHKEGFDSPGDRNGHGSRSAEYPILRFRAPDGRLVETQAEIAPSYGPKHPDMPVPVLFDPADPSRARLADHGDRGYLTGGIFLVIGSMMGAMAIVLAL